MGETEGESLQSEQFLLGSGNTLGSVRAFLRKSRGSASPESGTLLSRYVRAGPLSREIIGGLQRKKKSSMIWYPVEELGEGKSSLLWEPRKLLTGFAIIEAIATCTHGSLSNDQIMAFCT